MPLKAEAAISLSGVLSLEGIMNFTDLGLMERALYSVNLLNGRLKIENFSSIFLKKFRPSGTCLEVVEIQNCGAVAGI